MSKDWSVRDLVDGAPGADAGPSNERGAPVEADSAAEEINRRYRILRCLGRGGMGDVSLVEDLHRDCRRLALKRVRRDKADARSVATLRNEYLTLARLPHPHLVRTHEFGVDTVTGDLFYTAEYVEGTDWLNAARILDARERADLEVLVGMLAQVLRALDFIHSRGVVHVDLKPENLLFILSAEEGREGLARSFLKIIDFGLARAEGTQSAGRALGTPYYVAPETLLGSRIDRRTDLYSLGVVFYRLLTGRPPFTGASNLEILKGHVERAPVPPQEVLPGLDREVGRIALRLMEKRPADRFQSALEVLDHLDRAMGLSIPLETQETLDACLGAVGTAGREEVTSRLRVILTGVLGLTAEELEQALVSEGIALDTTGSVPQASPDVVETGLPPGRMVLLRGEKGLGKRRLVESLRDLAWTREVRVMEVDCGESPGSLDPFLAEVTGLCASTWPEGLPEHLQVALGMKEESRTPLDPAAEEGYRSALEEVSTTLLTTSREQPTILLFHALHLAGDVVLDVIRTLVDFVSRDVVPKNRFVLVGTTLDRTDTEGTALQRACDTILFQTQILEIKLTRLDAGGVERWLHAAFPGNTFPSSFVGRLAEESDGNIDAMRAILRHLLDRGKITRTTCGWDLSSDYESEDFPGRIRSVLKQRLADLPIDVLRLAQAFACLGDGGDLETAVRLAGIPQRHADRCLNRLEREKVLEAKSENRRTVYHFVHASARTILYQQISAPRLQTLHEEAGSCLESRKDSPWPASPKVLAHHFLRAGNREKGIRYGLAAARELAGESRPVEAIACFEEILDLAGDDEKLRATVQREIAALRFKVGDYRGVLSLLGGLCPPGQVPVEAREGTSAYVDGARASTRLGRFREAESILEAARRSEAIRKQSDAITSIELAQAELHHSRGDPVASLRHCQGILADTSLSKTPDLLCQLHMLTAEDLECLGDAEGAAGECQAVLRILDPMHDNRLLAWNLFCRGKYYASKRQLQEALKQFQLSRILWTGSSSLDGQADCLLEMGRVLTRLGRVESARGPLEEALRLYEKSGNLARGVNTRMCLAGVYQLLGLTVDCHRSLREVLERSEALDARRLTLETLLVFAAHAIDHGRLEEAGRYIESAEAQANRGRAATGGVARLALLSSELHFQEGDLGSAISAVARGLILARKGGDPFQQADFLAREAFLSCRLGRGGESRRSMVALLDIGRRHDFALAEGRAQLLEGMAFLGEGKSDASERAFLAAKECFLKQESARDLAAYHLERGRMCLDRGDHEEAYLCMEEGLHLSRRLGLVHTSTEFQLAMGELEEALGADPRAWERFREAERLAQVHGFAELLWRARFALARVFARSGSPDEEVRSTQAARETLAGVLDRLPPRYHESYLRMHGLEEAEQIPEGGVERIPPEGS